MKCARCGKKFIMTSAGWGYMYGGKYACSYKCMREMEREDAGVTEEEKKRAEEMDAQGMDAGQISEELKVSRHAVAAYLGSRRRKLEAAKDAPDEDLKLMAIRLMDDMMEILKRIV